MEASSTKEKGATLEDEWENFARMIAGDPRDTVPSSVGAVQSNSKCTTSQTKARTSVSEYGSVAEEERSEYGAKPAAAAVCSEYGSAMSADSATGADAYVDYVASSHSEDSSDDEKAEVKDQRLDSPKDEKAGPSRSRSISRSPSQPKGRSRPGSGSSASSVRSSSSKGKPDPPATEPTKQASTDKDRKPRDRSRSSSRNRDRARRRRSRDRRRHSRSRSPKPRGSRDRRHRRRRSRDRHHRRRRHSPSPHRRRSRSPHVRRSRSRDRHGPRPRYDAHKGEQAPKKLTFKEHLKQSLIQAQKEMQKTGMITLNGNKELSTYLISNEAPSKLPIYDDPMMAVTHGAELDAKVTPQLAFIQSMQAMHKKAQELTGVAVPKYYNPAAVNPLKYAEQVQKRKLLWSKSKDEKPEIASQSTNTWSAAAKALENDPDGKTSAKFKKLMGIKAPAEESEEDAGAEELKKKQLELFSQLDKEYEFARMATHTHKGIGLGYSSHYSAFVQSQTVPQPAAAQAAAHQSAHAQPPSTKPSTSAAPE